LKFWITNSNSTTVTLSNLKLIWPSPASYYNIVRWNGNIIRDGNPGLGSGDPAVFAVTQTINPGEKVLIQIETFGANPGGGSPVDMTGTAFTVEFSDGSTITFTANLCAG